MMRLEVVWQGIEDLTKRQDVEGFWFFDENRKFIHILSFYQVNRSTPNNLPNTSQTLQSQPTKTDFLQTSKAPRPISIKNEPTFFCQKLENLLLISFLTSNGNSALASEK
jgi:hypothetical protein